MQIRAVRGALPIHRYRQEQITEQFIATVGDGTSARLVRRIHANCGVDYRHTALPLEQYGNIRDFGAANDAYLGAAVDLGARALVAAADAAGVPLDEIDLLISATVTGLAIPSLDARIIGQLPMREDTVRMPLVGLGCVAGAAGISRLNDYLLGHPDQTAALVAVELCSLTLQSGDQSTANIVASGLFGDGAAAVIAVGSQRAARCGGPSVVATRSRLYPNSERTMGFDVTSSGLQIVLDASVPAVVQKYLAEDVDRFLADHQLSRSDIGWYVAHPGGPKVLEAMACALGLSADEFAVTWQSLAQIGNLSSASVLHVLADTLQDRPPPAGSYGLLIAMGPGFCSEIVLLRASEQTG